MQLPAGETASLGGKKWLKVDLADAAKAAGMNAAQVTDQFNNLDPGKQIKAMLASNQLKAAGEDTVDGVKTVHYTGDINLEQYLDAYSTPAGRATIKAGLVKAGLKSIKTDLWVDEKYQVRKASVVSGPMDVTCTYADYGKPVNVVAPPAGETADMMELLKGLGKTPA
jgi:hypothetical protein